MNDKNIEHWEYHKDDGKYHCSGCGYMPDVGECVSMITICPNCGARTSESLWFMHVVGESISRGLQEGITK